MREAGQNRAERYSQGWRKRDNLPVKPLSFAFQPHGSACMRCYQPSDVAQFGLRRRGSGAIPYVASHSTSLRSPIQIDPSMSHPHLPHPLGTFAPISGLPGPAARLVKRAHHDASPSLADEQAYKKRKKNTQSHQTSASLHFIVVHKVLCDRHKNHPRESKYYKDTPKLHQGDDRTAHLRGTTLVQQDVLGEDFEEEAPDVSFVVIREYDCGSYHDAVRDKFEEIPILEEMAGVLKKFLNRLQLAVLAEDGLEAEPKAERLILTSQGVSSGMDSVRAAYSSYFTSRDSATGSLLSPYTDFYHGRTILKKEILDSLKNLSGEQKKHLTMLSDYIQSSNAADYREADELFRRGMVSRRHFEKLFAPNDIVVRATDAGPVAYQVRGVENLHLTLRTIRLDCWSWAFDGKFYKDHSRWDIPWSSRSDEISIDSLPLYPLRLSETSLRSQLSDCGTTFWECRNRKMVEYNSIGSVSELQPDSNRYMIDLVTYKKMHAESSNDASGSPVYQEGIESLKEPPTYPFLILLPATIRGFRFHDKKLSTLMMERITPVQWSDENFDRRLVLKGQKKELIKALVTMHTADRRVKVDIIEGKGRGLILLLHGGPGTGRTLTAESIAEYAKRPLYRVTCGDIGTDPESVERYLESVMYIGTLWGCVVLLDEADVFLEERVPTDLQRNALVSVFLRTLEYFEGILVLTSNRVGTFDEAFKSRVQLAMHYPPLDEGGRWQIWDMLLKELLKDEECSRYDEMKEKLNFLARHKLNGRQIRNTINTARQLARHRTTVLAYEHLEIALDVVNEFELYVTGMRGHTDEEYAQAQGHR